MARRVSVAFMFGEWDGFTVGRLNALLAPHGLQLKVESNRKLWGKKVKLTVETVTERLARRGKAVEAAHRANREARQRTVENDNGIGE